MVDWQTPFILFDRDYYQHHHHLNQSLSQHFRGGQIGNFDNILTKITTRMFSKNWASYQQQGREWSAFPKFPADSLLEAPRDTSARIGRVIGKGKVRHTGKDTQTEGRTCVDTRHPEKMFLDQAAKIHNVCWTAREWNTECVEGRRRHPDVQESRQVWEAAAAQNLKLHRLWEKTSCRNSLQIKSDILREMCTKQT